MEQHQATATLSGHPVDTEQAEAAIVEHYPRLVRLGYLVLPPGLGRTRRVLTAHSLAQRALPRGRNAAAELPGQRPAEAERRVHDSSYAFVRLRVLRAALRAARPRRAWEIPRRDQLPPLLPQVWGLRLFPRSGGADELALDQALSGLSPAGRAAYALRALDGLEDGALRAVLDAAGVDDAHEAVAEADGVRSPAGSRDGVLLASTEFDPCSLQARPTDLMRRRQHTRAALAAAAAVVVCGALLGLPGKGWGPDGAAAPSYARNAAAEQALDPAELTHAAPAAWKRATRVDFSSWPARGDRVDDKALLRRALAVWARPGGDVAVSTTPGTPLGPPAGPPQLLYAGKVDRLTVVLMYDGLRVVRYAEPDGADSGAVALDFVRVDAADAASSTALVVGRADGNVRYLTAPWVRDAAQVDLLKPGAAALPLHRDADGVTDPVRGPGQSRSCGSWEALRFGRRLVTDLGELVPARLTYGPPGQGTPRDASAGPGRASWSHLACQLPLMRARGVRTVNAWEFAGQRLPEGAGSAVWACTRGETWRGTDSRVLTQFRPSSASDKPAAPSGLAAGADGGTACGPREPRVVAGVLWKAPAGHWYLLAAGSRAVSSITVTGGVRGSATGRLLSVPAKQGARADIKARLADGSRIAPPH